MDKAPPTESKDSDHTTQSKEEPPTYVTPPPFSPSLSHDFIDPQPDTNGHPHAPPHQQTTLHAQLSSLSRSQLEQRLIDTDSALHTWRTAATHLFTSLALSPEMTDAVYARSLRAMLKSALESLDSLESLRHVECSMPSVAKEAPSLDLIRWDGLHFSEWHVEWAPASWWVSVSADGSRWGLAFNCLTNVSNIRLNGLIQCSFSHDLTALRLRFATTPYLHLDVNTAVGWGIVPVPVQQSIAQIIRDQIDSFVDTRLCSHDGMVVVLRRKSTNPLSDSDVSEATSQAKRANAIRLRAATLL